MEDYKEKYEQALKKAKAIHNLAIETSHENTRMTVEELFPELKESEDKRIIKAIIEFVKQNKSFTHCKGVSKDDCLAWLEKQGEQKPNFCHHEVDFSYCSDEYRKAYYDGWNNCNQQHAQLEAKQKPAWSEDDEIGLGDALWAVQQAKTIAKDENDMGNLWYAEYWLKSLKERMK